MRLVAFVLCAAACGKGDTKASPEVQGTLSLDGKPLAITKCRAGRGVTTYVELVTAAGKLRFEDKQLFWTKDDFGRGDKLECEKLDRSWGGGLRKDGTSYFRGHLIFVCRGPAGPLAGDVTVDCGGITAEEREQLDKNRADMRAEQAAAAKDRCEDVEKHEAELFGPARAQAVEQAKAAGLSVSPDGIVKQAGGTTIRAFPKPMAFTACREDKWPAAVQDCTLAASDITAWDACLTPELREAITRRQHEP